MISRPDVVRGRSGQPRDVPRPHGQPVGPDDEFALGLLAPGVVEQRPEVGIDVQQADHVWRPGQWDRASSHDLRLPGAVGFQTFIAQRTSDGSLAYSGWFSRSR